MQFTLDVIDFFMFHFAFIVLGLTYFGFFWLDVAIGTEGRTVQVIGLVIRTTDPTAALAEVLSSSTCSWFTTRSRSSST